MNFLKIGELAGLTGTNNETLRFYETKGLLLTPRRSETGYRLFTQNDVDRVRFIVRARRMGFTLKEVAYLLSLQVEKAVQHAVRSKSLLNWNCSTLMNGIAELDQMKRALTTITGACIGGDETAEHCTILNALADAEYSTSSGSAN